ncbi:MAG: DUF6046 domain-containing protein, partial [Fastidiosipilaceae bacterium]
SVINAGLHASELALTDSVRRSMYVREVLVDEEEFKNDLLLVNQDNNTEIYLRNVKIDVVKENNIVKTIIAGNRDKSCAKGRIKEYIQAEDYKVKVSFTLFAQDRKGVGRMSTNRNFPFDGIKALNSVLDKIGTFDVDTANNNYLNRCFGISKLVFEKCDFNQSSMKYKNAMPISIDFLSDEDYDFLVFNS